MTTRRFLSLWLPRLATDRARRLHRIDARAPLAAMAKIANAERLVGVDANAARLGLAVGLSLADARARHPALVAVEANPAEERRLLEALCHWSSRYTPLAALDRADGLMLDISGVAHLFGGEQGLVEDALARLARQGFAARAGVADNPRAAWALARFSAQTIAPEALSEKAFAKLFHDLPLAALGLEAKTLADMARAGLRRIGDVAMRPRAPITARFGTLPVARLDELKGLTRASIAPLLSPPDFSAERRFASPIADGRGDRGLLAQARRRPRRAARAAGEGGAADRAYAPPRRRRRAPHRGRRLAADQRSARHQRLFAERLASPDEDAIDAGFGVDLMRLSCLAAEPLAPSQSRDRARARGRAGPRARRPHRPARARVWARAR